MLNVPVVRQTLVLSYAYHCCEFMPLMEGAVEESAAGGLSDLVLAPPPHLDAAAWANLTDVWPHLRESLMPPSASK